MDETNGTDVQSAEDLRRELKKRTRVVRSIFWLSVSIPLLLIWAYFWYSSTRVKTLEVKGRANASIVAALSESGVVAATGTPDPETGTPDPQRVRTELVRLRDEVISLRKTVASCGDSRGTAAGSSLLEIASIGFEFGQTTLDESGTRKVQDAIQKIRGAQVKRVFVEGRADTVGDDEKNYQLSEQRSQTVASALLAGLDGTVEVRQQHFGERRLVKLTGDSVASSENRTVVISGERQPN